MVGLARQSIRRKASQFPEENSDVVEILSLLKTCSKEKDLQKGTSVHADILQRRLLLKNRYVASALINMYTKCGALVKAAQVLNELPFRDVYSWSALIAGYAQEGQGEEVLKCYRQMLREGRCPNAVTFISILKACGRMGALDEGKGIHAEVSSQGLLRENVTLGTALVDMYAKCGAFVEALLVLDELPLRNLVSWNALIAGYSQHRWGVKSLKSMKHMQCEGISPNASTFTCILKACADIGALDYGSEIHEEIERQGLLEKDAVLATTLADMYAKCGAIAQAVRVLDELPVLDVVSWNSLISGYSQVGRGEEALRSFEQMKSKGFFPNVATFICILKACGSIGAVEEGERIHQEIVRQGLLAKETLLGNALVDMYAKCGALSKAATIHQELPARNVISWSALIEGYAEQGLSNEALSCFQQMQSEGFSPNIFTFTSILKACGSIKAVDKGEEIHREVLRQGLLGRDILLGSALVDMYVKCGALSKAANALQELPVRSVVSWSVLIEGYAEQGLGKDALICFKKMQSEGFSPNLVTFMSVLKACGSMKAVDKGEEIHSEVVRRGLLEKDIILGSALVDMYAKCGLLSRAAQVLDNLPFRDVVAWNALIAGFVQLGQDKEVLAFLEQMQLEGISPNAVTLACKLKASGVIRAADKINELHK